LFSSYSIRFKIFY